MTSLTLDRPRPDGIPPAGPVEPSQSARLTAVPPAPDWSHAACAAYPDLPWVPGGPTAERDALAELAPICARCPVAAACLSWATQVGVVGIWGGTTTATRRGPVHEDVTGSPRLCTVDDCGRPLAGGYGQYCHTHRRRHSRGEDLTAPIKVYRQEPTTGTRQVCTHCAAIADLIGDGTHYADLHEGLGWRPASVGNHLRHHGSHSLALAVDRAERAAGVQTPRRKRAATRADQVVSLVRAASWRAEQAQRRGAS